MFQCAVTNFNQQIILLQVTIIIVVKTVAKIVVIRTGPIRSDEAVHRWSDRAY